MGMARPQARRQASRFTRDWGIVASFLSVCKRALGIVLSLEKKNLINKRKKEFSLGNLLRTMFQALEEGIGRNLISLWKDLHVGRVGSSHC